MSEKESLAEKFKPKRPSVKTHPLASASNDQLRRELSRSKQVTASLRLTQFAVDRAADAIFWVGPDARLLYVNDQACHSLGYTRNQLLSMTVHDIDLDFPKSAWPSRWQNLRAHGAIVIESRHRRKDGSVFPVEIAANFLPFDGREYNCVFVRDISERKATEAKLRESERRFRTLTEATAAATFIYRKNRICYVNSQAQALTGYSQDELLSMNFWEVLHPDFQELTGKRGLARLRGDQVTSRYEVKIRKRGGEIRWLDFTARAVEFEQEPALLGTAFDITDAKRASNLREQFSRTLLKTLEEERRRISRELHDHVGQLLVALGLQVYALRQSRRDNVIVRRQDLEKISRRLRDAADSVADLARDYHPAELNDLGLSAAIECFTNEFAKRHDISVLLSADHIDDILHSEQELQLYRLLQEALTNVVKHAKAQTVRVALTRNNGELVMVVEDDGRGFDPSAAARASTGLGLTTMKERTKILHGRLSLSSRSGNGTRLQVTIPLPYSGVT